MIPVEIYTREVSAGRTILKQTPHSLDKEDRQDFSWSATELITIPRAQKVLQDCTSVQGPNMATQQLAFLKY